MRHSANKEVEQASQYLTFWLGDEVFGVDIRSVREIIQCGAMASVPLMPPFVRGVINLRGSVVPVIDLNVRFGRRAATICKKSCIVVFDVRHGPDQMELGMLVDAVSEVIKIAPTDIEPPPDFGGSIRRDFIQAIAKVRTGFVILLEPDRALNVEEMSELCEAAQDAAVA